MMGEELRTSAVEVELIRNQPADNVYEFPDGQKRVSDEERVLQDLEKALENWF